MKLLNQLYSIHSMSGQEGAMRKFVKNYVKEMNGDIVLRQDHGNIYITKGEAETYPCLIAHLDQVQTKHSPDFRTFISDGSIFGYSLQNKRLEGLGADDKNGIWIALKCLERAPVLKVALFKEEEIGCGGSSIADMSFFKDCRFCVQADRRNGGDLITDICGPICSKEFVDALAPAMKTFGYEETCGLMTDVETLSDRGVGLSCINLSCGYYDPHTDHETTNINELYNALGFVWWIVENLTEVYPFTRPVRESYYGYFGGYGNYNRGWWHTDVEVLSPSDYANPQQWLEEFIWRNYDIDPDELWPYVQADCDTFGITEEDFYGLFYDIYEYAFEEEPEPAYS